MSKNYTAEMFEKDKEAFIRNFREKYYSIQEYNSQLDLVCAFNLTDNKFEIFGLSSNTYVPKNYYTIFRAKGGMQMDEDYDFKDLNEEIYEIVKTLDKEEIGDFIKNNGYNLTKIDEIDNKTLSSLLADIETISKDESTFGFEKDEFLFAVANKNHFFQDYLLNNLYKGFYVEGANYYNDTEILITQIEELKYSNIFEKNVFSDWAENAF